MTGLDLAACLDCPLDRRAEAFDHICDIINRGHITARVGDANEAVEKVCFCEILRYKSLFLLM